MPEAESLLIENLPDLKRYALHLTRNGPDAEDLLQDCVERALVKRDLFAPGSNYRAWLFAIMHNAFLNKKRRQHVANAHLADLKLNSSPASPPSQEAAVMLSRTFDALQRLSEEEREAVALLGVEQLSYRELAARTSAPIGTLKSRVFRGRARLHEMVFGSAS